MVLNWVNLLKSKINNKYTWTLKMILKKIIVNY